MKTHIMFRRALTALAFAAALALPPKPAQAQTNDATQPKKEAVNSASIRGIQYDLEIEGGRLAGNVDEQFRIRPPELDTIVKILRGKHPEANIAMSPELNDVRVSDLKLHASSVGEALEALRIASGGKFIWKATQLSPDAMSPLFTLEPSEQFLKENSALGSPQVEVFNFSSYFALTRTAQRLGDDNFQAFKQQTILSTREIVGKTVASLNVPGPLDFQFHEGANLLVVTGSPQSINVAKKIINAIIEQPGTLNTGVSNAAQSDAMRRLLDENAARLLEQKTILEDRINRLRTNGLLNPEPSRPNFVPIPPATGNAPGGDPNFVPIPPAPVNTPGGKTNQ